MIRRKPYDMDGGWALILSAVVTAVGGIIVTLITVFRKENREDHDNVMAVLRIMHKGIGRVETKVDKVDDRLSKHLQFHADQERMLDNATHVHQNGTASNSKVSKKGVSRRR